MDDDLKREIAALRRIEEVGGHAHVANLKDYFEDEKNMYLIMELVQGGELFDHLLRQGPYSEKQAASLIWEIASALLFLHEECNIIHADIKPDNIMLSSWNDADAKVKIVDFGCALAREPPPEGRPSRVGTIPYWPPEVVNNGAESWSPAGDVWGLGCLLFIALTGTHPFDRKGVSAEDVIKSRIKEYSRGAPFELLHNHKIVGHLSDSAVDLIAKLMDRNPQKRLSASEVLAHPWVQGITSKSESVDSMHDKLKDFRQLQQQLQAGVFAALIQAAAYPTDVSGNEPNPEINSNTSTGEGLVARRLRSSFGNADPGLDLDDDLGDGGETPSIDGAIQLVKRAVSIFDDDKKGFVSEQDIRRVLANSTGLSLDSSELVKASAHYGHNVLGVEEFAALLSKLEVRKIGPGKVLFHEGDKGDCMYFINAGKVAVCADKENLGTLIVLKPGAFFGESSLVTGNPRNATVRTLTPCHVTVISREQFEQFTSDGGSVVSQLEGVQSKRAIVRAKQMFRVMANVRTFTLEEGESLFHQGGQGDAVYSIIEGDFAVVLEHDDGDGHRNEIEVARLSQGDLVGETALINDKTRSATVTCRSKSCMVNEVKANQFKELLRSSPDIFEAIEALSTERSKQLTRTATNNSAASVHHPRGGQGPPPRHETES